MDTDHTAPDIPDSEPDNQVSDPDNLRKKVSKVRKKAERGTFKRFCSDAASVLALLKAGFLLFKLFWDFLQHGT